jgi:hypothetical protein
MKFKIGDVVAYYACDGAAIVKIVDIVSGGIRVVSGRWQDGKARRPVSDSYVCEYISGASPGKTGTIRMVRIGFGDLEFTNCGGKEKLAAMKFKIGDVVTYSASSGDIVVKVVDVVTGGARTVYGKWQDGWTSHVVLDSYVCEYISGASPGRIGTLGLISIKEGDAAFTHCLGAATPQAHCQNLSSGGNACGTATKFRVGDLVARAKNPGGTVLRVVDVITDMREVFGMWQCGQSSLPVENSYVCEYIYTPISEFIGRIGTVDIDYGNSEFVHYDNDAVAFSNFSVGDVVWLKNPGNYGQDGPYEIVEAVHSKRQVNYCWQGGASHPREVDSAWIVKDRDGEHLVIEFSKRDRLSVARRENHAGICPRCGGKMVEKMSHGFIGESQFAVKKCLSCGNCL